MRAVYNFGAGPAMLPEEVLREAQAEMLDWHQTGMSIMEIGHRTPDYKTIIEQSEADLRELMQIPANYHVLFLAGGASTQFAMVPLNLFAKNNKADYLDTGIWSKKAIAEAKRYGEVNIATQVIEESKLLKIPAQAAWQLSDDAAYVHYTPNETIEGVQFHQVPTIKDKPLVADMTSMILSEPVDVSQFGIIYAGAQKNISHAGINVVIIRDDLVHDSLPFTPTLYRYQAQVEAHSLYNTPPTYSWYMAGLVFAWMKRRGGVAAFHQINQRKAQKLYAVIDQHAGFYCCRIHPSCRSIMNVMFYLQDESLTAVFLEESKQIGLVNLRGHRVSGGLRASIYNAMPEEGVDALVDFMREFVRKHG